MVKPIPRKRKKTKSEIVAAERKKRKTHNQKSVPVNDFDGTAEDTKEESDDPINTNEDTKEEPEVSEQKKKLNRKQKKRLENFLVFLR